MNNFIFQSPTELIFGQGQIKEFKSKVLSYGNNVLLVMGGGSVKKIGLYDEIYSVLSNEQINIIELAGVKPNPRIDLVRKGVKLCKDNKIDIILAVGGGSVIDTAKAISAGALYDGDAWEMITKEGDPEETLPLGVILTIAATGSEMNGNAVISNMEIEQKLVIQSPTLVPQFAILDPSYTCSVPLKQTVYGIVDIAAHVFEQYFSHTDNTPLQDRLAEGLLKTLIEESEKVLQNPEDYSARANILLCATMALNGGIYFSNNRRTFLLGMGKVTDFASHRIEHEISAIYDIPHGGGLAILFPNWMKYVINEQEEIDKFVQYAIRVFNISLEDKSDKEVALEGIKATRQWFNKLGAPETLADYKIDDENLEIMAEKAVASGPLGSYKKLDKEDVYEILKMCL